MVIAMYIDNLSPTRRALPDPPRLHWGWVLALNIITRGIFEPIWLIVQANWVRKVLGKSKALPWAIVYVCMFPAIFGMAFFVAMVFIVMKVELDPAYLGVLMVLAVLIAIGTRLAAIYILRDELAQAPMHIVLGGVMTFFFGATYFQYHLRDFTFEGASHSALDGTLGLSIRS